MPYKLRSGVISSQEALEDITWYRDMPGSREEGGPFSQAMWMGYQAELQRCDVFQS